MFIKIFPGASEFCGLCNKVMSHRACHHHSGLLPTFKRERNIKFQLEVSKNKAIIFPFLVYKPLPYPRLQISALK